MAVGPYYTTYATSSGDGPLVSPTLNPTTAAYLLATDPSGLVTYVNGRLQQAEAALPEGTLEELRITGWTVAGQSLATYVASQLNAAAAAGEIRQPDGELVPAWPAADLRAIGLTPGLIAWGDDRADAVTVRTVKGQPWLAYVVVGLLGVLAVAIVIGLMSGAKWAASSVQFLGSLGRIGTWLVRNWEVPALVLAAGAAVPLVIHYTASVQEDVNALRYAGRGGF